MNQNRNSNRRRGRGNNRGQGGGNQGNRIDSRARGNAPQLLEKYKKLAHDASLNGDRVQTEYYLQFADHYFRVIADNRAQKEDVRPRHGNDRETAQEFEDEDEEEQVDRGRSYRSRAEREDEEETVQEGEPGSEGDEIDEQPNPFLRDRRSRRSRGRGRAARDEDTETGESDGEGGFDPQILPPSIGRAKGGDESEAQSGEEPPAAKPRRGRKPRAADQGDSEPLEAVG